MKLIRFGEPGQEKPGLQLSDNKRIDASAFGEDYNEAFFENDGLNRLKTWADQNAASAPEVSDSVRLGSPICRPSKIVCIGLNYRDHAIESGLDIPTEPIVFFKSTTALVGPNDNVVIPKNSEKTDWEVELAFVIGKKASYVEKKDAYDYVAGYAVHNDVSERHFQIERGGQWVKGKSNDTFAPLGPYMVTKDEIEDPNKLDLWLTLNGKKIQNSNTKEFIFDVPTVLSYLSQFMTLLPGDFISTGTPPGVGLGMDPPLYLKPGDIVELGVEGLGTQKQNFVAYSG